MRAHRTVLPGAGAEVTARQITLSELLATLRRRKRTLAASLLALLLPALAYVAMAKPEYTSTTELFVDPRPKRGTEQETIASGLGQDAALIESQLRIIASDAVMGRVVDRLELDKDPEFGAASGNGPLSGLRRRLTAEPERAHDTKLAARDALAKQVRLKRPEKTYIIAIEVTSEDPEKAARIAQAIAETYLADQSSAKSDDARQTSQNLNSRLDELRAHVKDADAKVETFKRQNLMLMSEGSLVNEQQLTRTNAELVTIKGAAATAKARYDQVQAAMRTGGTPETLTEAVNSPLIQRLRTQYVTTAREEASLRSTLMPAHPRLLQVRSELDEQRRQIAAELKRIAAAAQGEWQIAARREGAVEREMEALKGLANKTNLARIGLGELEQEAESSRQLLRTFLARAKETGEQQTFYRPDARILTPAAVPTRPSRPQRLLILAMAAAGGLALGIGRVLMAEHRDLSLRSAADAERVLGIGQVASVPVLAPATGLSGSLGFKRRPTGFHDVFQAIMHGHGTPADPFRAAIFSLLHGLRPIEGTAAPRVVFLTSPSRGDGKSTLLAGLGMASALLGERVLLIDADHADPQLSRVFGGNVRPAQPDAPLPIDAGVNALIVEDANLPLSIVPLALFRQSPLKWAEQRRFLAELTVATRNYDLVLIDGGSHPGSLMARSLSGLADTVLVCARAGVTPADAIAATWKEVSTRRQIDASAVVTMVEGI